MTTLTLMTHFPFKKAGCLVLIGLILSLIAPSHAVAETFTAECRVGNGRSSVAVRSTGLKGKYYVLVFSGEDNSLMSEPKTANRKRILDFRFDSDPAYLSEHPEPLAFFIKPNFIKKREIAVVLRDFETNAYVGGMRTKCKKHQPNGVPIPANNPPKRNLPAQRPAPKT